MAWVGGRRKKKVKVLRKKRLSRKWKKMAKKQLIFLDMRSYFFLEIGIGMTRKEHLKR